MNPDEIEQIDQSRIYAKTPAGEEAILHRTLVVQRNLRMVLILVDGNATVADLCNKTSNPQLTYSALAELEKDGFIEARVEKDSVWLPDKKPLWEEPASVDEVSEFSTFGDKDDVAPTHTTSRELPPPIPAFPSRSGTFSLSPKARTPLSLPPLSVSQTQFAVVPDAGTVFLAKDEAMPVPSARPSVVARASAFFRALRSSSGVAEVGEGADLKPIPRGGKVVLPTWPMLVLLTLLASGALLAVLALFFPYARYLPEVEKSIAQMAGRPVRIEEMRFVFYPKPALVLVNVHLDRGAAGNPIRLGEVRLQPSIGSLFSSHRTFREIALSRWNLSADAVVELSKLLQTATRQAGEPLARQLVFDKTDISFAGIGIADLHGTAAMDAVGALQTLSLQSADRNLQFDATAEAGGLKFRIQGLDWRAATGSRYVFNALNLQGRVDGAQLTMDSIEGRIFDGVVSGSAVLRDVPQAAAAGELTYSRIDIGKLGEVLGTGRQFQGEATGKLRFSLGAQEGGIAPESLRADGRFTVHRGSLGAIDLAEAVRRGSTAPLTLGGETRFDQLSGALNLAPTGYRFSPLLLTAGLMRATGQLEVSPDLQLRGRMSVMMGRATTTPIPIAVGGSLASPLLQTVGR